jgi:WXG100 family type VII secretion target
MAGFGTTPEQMHRAAVQVQQVNEQVQAQLTQLRNQLAPLSGGWKGEASTAFEALMVRWDSDARALSQALQSIGESIRLSGVSYQRAEQAHRQNMSAITSALG